MKLVITSEAQNWFKKEVAPTMDKGIRFFGKVYGSTNIHEGFSIAMSVESPEQPMVELTLDGITYFIEETDDWFFIGYDLYVAYDELKDEPTYRFERMEE